jgi:iron complex outermembrane receptor protein
MDVPRTVARLVSALVLTFALSGDAYAQAPATLSGVVNDAGGQGLSGAIVTVTPADGGPTQTARSNASGEYAIERVAPGGYVTEVRFGTVVTERIVTVGPGRNTADFQLDIGQSSEIVTVTAQKREEPIERAPVAVTVLAGANLQRAGITQVTELSDDVPNLHITNAGGRATINYLGLRGFINSNQSIDPSMAIYVDGVPVTDFFSTAQTLYDIERVEIIKGPQGTLYGVNSQAGVIDIRSRRPTNDWRGGASVQAGSFGSYTTTAAVSGPS